MQDVSPHDTPFVLAAIRLLEIAICTMRCRPTDLVRGVMLADQAIASPIQPYELVDSLLRKSILLQQLATAHASNDVTLAASLQHNAVCAYDSYLMSLGKAAPNSLHEYARRSSMAGKYSTIEPPHFTATDVDSALAEASQQRTMTITYLADVILSGSKRTLLGDRILGGVDALLEHSGYGQDFDYIRAIVLRRRWWLLRAFLGVGLDLDLLSRDLSFWHRIHHANEIRELARGLERVLAQNPSPELHSAVAIVRPAIRKRRSLTA